MMNKIKQSAGLIIVFAAILLIGVFLRTYQFHDLVRFNADQARDAALVSQVLEGKESWPILGPKAGGTNFRLGAAFYYFQIMAGKIFGNSPDKFAYPDLIFSLLSIPLLFFFLKKYFNARLALMLTALYGVSFYAIKYSRFAWNPNATPFWTILFLYALLQIFDQQGKKRIWWSVVAGVAVGIGVQLHTFLLVAMPVLTAGYFIYLSIKKNHLWKNFAFVLLVSVCLNIPQIYGEIKTGGENMQALFYGAATKQESKSLFSKVVRTGECFMTASAFTVSSLGNDDDCAIFQKKSSKNIFDLVFGGLLFAGGILLAIRRLRKESDMRKRRFLGLILAYAGLLFLLMVPVAYELSLRYFLIIAFLPFVLLGLGLEFLENKYQKNGLIFCIGAVVILAGANLWTVRNNFIAWSNHTRTDSMEGFDNVYLGELEMMANYIASQSDLSKDVFLAGNKNYLFKASNGIIYLAGKRGLTLQSLDKKKNNAGSIVFYLISTKSASKQKEELGATAEILDFQSFGRFALLKVRLK